MGQLHFTQPASASQPLPAPALAEASFMDESGSQGIGALTDQALFEACGCRIAFTNRLGGFSKGTCKGLNVSAFIGDDPSCVRANHQLIIDCLTREAGLDDLIHPQQVHGSQLAFFGPQGSRSENCQDPRQVDGVVVTQAGRPALLSFADCTPVAIVAPTGDFALVHAGWRGALAGIARRGLSALCLEAGVSPSQCNAYVGPHIDSCCYETSQEILDQFVQAFGPSCDGGGRHLSLTAAVVASLVEGGLDPSRVALANACTSCQVDTYYSYRAEAGSCGRHGAFAIKEA